MENKHCNRCGEEYSSTYHKCPFCQEAAAERRGHPIYRRGRRLDLRQRSAGAGGVIKLVLLSVALIVAGVVFYGDNIAEFLGIRTQTPTVQHGDTQQPSPSVDQQGGDAQTGSDSGTVSDEGTQTGEGNGEGAQSGENSDEGTSQPPEVNTTPLSLDQSSITIPSGQTARITATGGSGEIVWTSSNNEIATVDGGSVTGVAGGTVTITATTGNESVTCTVTVTGTPWVNPAVLSLNYTDFTLRAGDPPVQMKVKGTDSTVTWSSSNVNVATISSSGVVTRVGKGNATITAQVDGQTLTCIVRVS